MRSLPQKLLAISFGLRLRSGSGCSSGGGLLGLGYGFLSGFVTGLLCIRFRHELAVLGGPVGGGVRLVVDLRVQVDPHQALGFGVGNVSG